MSDKGGKSSSNKRRYASVQVSVSLTVRLGARSFVKQLESYISMVLSKSVSELQVVRITSCKDPIRSV